jgi:hypothetical protein
MRRFLYVASLIRHQGHTKNLQEAPRISYQNLLIGKALPSGLNVFMKDKKN